MVVELSSDNEDSIVSLVSPSPILEVPYVPKPTRTSNKMKTMQPKPKVTWKLKAVQKPSQRPRAGGQLAQLPVT